MSASIEKIILEALQEGTGVPTFMEVPEDPPARYIILERTGGGEAGYSYRTARIAVQSCVGRRDDGGSLLDAAELNEEVLDLMRDIQYKENAIRSCELNSTYNFTDTGTKRYRYQAVFDLVYFA